MGAARRLDARAGAEQALQGVEAPPVSAAQAELRYEQQIRAKVAREVDAAAHVRVSQNMNSGAEYSALGEG